MNKELFGVFGDRAAFETVRSADEFDRVVSGARVTVGVRDPALGLPNRTAVCEDGNGVCVLWGELYPPGGEGPAGWLAERYREAGAAALDEANGSYLAVLDGPDGAFVAGDLIGSWECFYGETPAGRVFGTDALAVARALPEASVDESALLEFLHLGGVLGDRTLLADLRRVPHDHALTARGTADLGRFAYEPRSFDYAGELAARLERALDRRRSLPGRTGVLLSAGYDSRAIVAAGVDVDRAYTLGAPGRGEAAVAAAVAEQYGVAHETLRADERYLAADASAYTQGVKESLHVHHAGYEDELAVDSIYHGLLWDTLLRGYFQPRDALRVAGVAVPRRRLDPDPDAARHLVDVLGYLPASEGVLADRADAPASPAEFAERVVEPRVEACRRAGESEYDALARFGVRNVLSTPFRAHLADRYVESFVAADRELVEWHLATPPERRSEATLVDALERIDADLLRHRPPDRPHRSRRLNEVEGFLRRVVPGVSRADAAWPDRRALYERAGLDDRLFGDDPGVRALPVRLKLRLRDAAAWLSRADPSFDVAPAALLRPPADR